MRLEGKRNAQLILEDGTVFKGVSESKAPGALGRIAVNSSVTGFQEILTDPSNTGKIIVFTTPHAGNYGAARKFCESDDFSASGAAVKSISPFYSNWQAETSFSEFLSCRKISFIEGLDTRSLAVRVREKGELKAAVTFQPGRKIDWAKVRDASTNEVSVKSIVFPPSGQTPLKIGILDLGCKKSMVSLLESRGAACFIIPFDATPTEISSLGLGGLVLSGGAEDEEGLSTAACTAEKLIGKLPLFGAGAGCLALGLALGGAVKTLLSGHRGMNYPVRPPASLKGSITTQNHRMVIDSRSTLRKAEASLVNSNDGTVEALESPETGVSGVMFEPWALNGEARPEILKFLNAALERVGS